LVVVVVVVVVVCFLLIFRSCFIPFFIHVVSSLAYLNLFGNKMLGCCYCYCCERTKKCFAIVVYRLKGLRIGLRNDSLF
jgi:hypothetical protein